MRGTHTGPYLALPATGRPCVLEGSNVFRIEPGRIAERWTLIDVSGLLAQLGARVVCSRLPLLLGVRRVQVVVDTAVERTRAGEAPAHPPLLRPRASAPLCPDPRPRRQGLNSHLVVADAAETKLCAWLSLSTFVGLLAYAGVGWTWIDPVAGFVIASFALKEAKEVWEAELVCDHD